MKSLFYAFLASSVLNVFLFFLLIDVSPGSEETKLLKQKVVTQGIVMGLQDTLIQEQKNVIQQYKEYTDLLEGKSTPPNTRGPYIEKLPVPKKDGKKTTM